MHFIDILFFNLCLVVYIRIVKIWEWIEYHSTYFGFLVLVSYKVEKAFSVVEKAFLLYFNMSPIFAGSYPVDLHFADAELFGEHLDPGFSIRIFQTLFDVDHLRAGQL